MAELIIVTPPGIEDITQKETRELTKKDPKKILEGRLTLKATKKDLETLKKARSIKKIYELKTSFKFKKEQEIYNQIKKIKIKIKDPFAVRCNREGQHPFNSQIIAAKTGEIFFKKKHKVNLEKPKTTIYIEIINDTCIIGLNPTDDLSKRPYRIKTHSQSVNACLAYAMIRLSNWKPSQILLDPFCKDGLIPIEAALYGNKKKLQIFSFDESSNSIKISSINAKIAKVYKLITFGRYEVEWLDTQFKKESVSAAITIPPIPSAKQKEEDVKKIYKELFYQLRYILKKDGLLVIASPKTKLIKECCENFKIKEERTVRIGGMQYILIVFEKV